ncbi:MAG: lipopolysaccharide heptosyltransferase II [Gemmatimonadales bacterium]|nr:lipopolysaccharide heptosyltransferase II [Gemmatimonadales bacterium]
MTAVVIQTAFLGDVVLTTPLLAALAERHGPVDVVTTPAAAPLLETHPAVRRVIAYDKRGGDRGWRGLRRLGRRLAAEGYERAYLPHRSLRTAALAWLARIPARIGFTDGWPFLYTHTRRRPPDGHEVDRLLALADRPPAAYPPTLRLTPEDRAAAAAVLEGVGDPLVALAPGSIWGSKRWPYFTQLAGRLSMAGANVVAVGGADDVGWGDAIVRAVGPSGRRAVNACGALTLRQSAAVIARAALLVTNDSAPLHLATAVGTPVIALFGPTVPEFGFGPIRDGDVTLGVVDRLPCRPCSPHGPPSCPLGHHRCMRDIGADVVAAAIEESGALRRRN